MVSFDPYGIIQAHQNRGKVFDWVELFRLTGQLPSEISTGRNVEQGVDPFWNYTQSAKNYTPWFDSQVLTRYSNPSAFNPVFSIYGATTRVVAAASQQEWALLVQRNFWYLRLLKIGELQGWLYAIPGVKQVSIVGSTALGLGEQTSDIDLAIQCYPGWCLVARFWLKMVLKFKGLDAHRFGLNLLLWLLNKTVKDSTWSSALYEYIQRLKQRQQLRIDCGLFFESWTQVEAYFGHQARQLWLWENLNLAKYGSFGQLLEGQAASAFGNCVYQQKRSWFSSLIHYFWWITLWAITPLALILILGQLPLFWLREKGNSNRLLGPRFISFYPRYHLEKYLVAQR